MELRPETYLGESIWGDDTTVNIGVEKSQDELEVRLFS